MNNHQHFALLVEQANDAFQKDIEHIRNKLQLDTITYPEFLTYKFKITDTFIRTVKQADILCFGEFPRSIQSSERDEILYQINWMYLIDQDDQKYYITNLVE